MRKKIFIIFGIVLAIIAASIVGVYLLGKTGIGLPPELAKCKDLQGNERDECFVKEIIKENNSQLCTYIDNTEIKDECYNRIAINTKDVSLCEKIIEKDKQQMCKAFVTKDEKFCNNIKENNNKDLCYHNIAVISDKSSLCNKISNENRLILCKIHFLKDPEICEKITYPSLKAKCLEISEIKK